MNSEPLPNINLPHDIITPPPVVEWPIAPGYWLLAIILIAGLFWAYHWYQRTAWRRIALRELNGLYKVYLGTPDPIQYAVQANRLLKRVALLRFPTHPVAPLAEKRWERFLKTTCPSLKQDPQLPLFIQACYQCSAGGVLPNAHPGLNILALHKGLTRWIRHHKVAHAKRYFTTINVSTDSSLSSASEQGLRFTHSLHTVQEGQAS